MADEAPPKRSTNFELAARERALDEAFRELNAAGQAQVMERARAQARARGIGEDSFGWGLTVLRNRNEILAAELGGGA